MSNAKELVEEILMNLKQRKRHLEQGINDSRIELEALELYYSDLMGVKKALEQPQ
jgi:hypothetical protein